jgi:hypothetical protein
MGHKGTRVGADSQFPPLSLIGACLGYDGTRPQDGEVVGGHRATTRSLRKLLRWQSRGWGIPVSRNQSPVAPELVAVSVPALAGVVVIATGEFDEYARLIAH